MFLYLFPPLCVLPYLCGLWFVSSIGNPSLVFPGSSAHENRKIKKEEAENAEVFFLKSLRNFDLSESVEKDPFAPCTLILWSLFPLRAPRPLRLSFLSPPEIKNNGGGDQYQDDPEKMEEGDDGSIGPVLHPDDHDGGHGAGGSPQVCGGKI